MRKCSNIFQELKVTYVSRDHLEILAVIAKSLKNDSKIVCTGQNPLILLLTHLPVVHLTV